MKIIHKSAWIHTVDRKVLSTLTKGKSTYYFPGGKPEGSETAAEALVREIKEELTIDIDSSKIEELGVFEAQAHGKDEDVKVIMTCFQAPYVGQITPASEIGEVIWFTYADKAKSSPVDNLVFDWLKERDLID